MKSRKWYGMWTGDAYALGPFVYDEAVNEKEARRRMTKWSGGPPREVWPTK